MNLSSPASLFIGGQVVPVLCEPDGWMTVLASDDSTDYSSLSLSDYASTGVMAALPQNLFFPLDQLQAFTQAMGV